MPNRVIGTEFKLSGEKEYKQALSDINSGMRVLKSEMELTAQRFADNSDSMAALTARGDVLERQILSQKDKITVLKEALSASAQQYGESDKRTQDWQVSLNKAEAELEKMNRELGKNQQATKKAADATDKTAESFESFEDSSLGLGDALNKLGGKLGMELPAGLTQSLNGMLKINPVAMGLTSVFVGMAKGIHEANQKLEEWARESGQFAGDTLDATLVTGLSAEALQEWNYAAELMGVRADTAQSSLAKLTRSISDARDGTGKAKDTFGELMVAITEADGSLRASEDVFWDVIEALSGIENASERDAAAMEIFGRSATELNPLILQGREAFDALATEAHNAGAVLSNDCLDALANMDDAQVRLLRTQEAVTRQISTQYAPYMEKSLTMTKDRIDDIGEALVDSGAVEAMGSMKVSAEGLLDPLAVLGKDLLPPVKVLLDGLAISLAWISDTADAAIGILTLNPQRYDTAMGKNPNQASHMQQVMYGPGYKNWQQGGTYGSNYYNPETGKFEGNYYHASGTDNFPGGYTWVGEAGPEKVFLPAGTQIQSAQESRMGGDTFIFNINADNIHEFNDLLALVENARIDARTKGGA